MIQANIAYQFAAADAQRDQAAALAHVIYREALGDDSTALNSLCTAAESELKADLRVAKRAIAVAQAAANGNYRTDHATHDLALSTSLASATTTFVGKKDRHHRIDFPAGLQYNHRIAPSCSGVFL